MAYLPLLQEVGFSQFLQCPPDRKGQVKACWIFLTENWITPTRIGSFFLEHWPAGSHLPIDNTTLLENLQRSNIELSLSYDYDAGRLDPRVGLTRPGNEGHTQWSGGNDRTAGTIDGHRRQGSDPHPPRCLAARHRQNGIPIPFC